MDERYGYITPNDYEIAEMNGINADNLEQRVRAYGWDIERATTQPVRNQKKSDRAWDEWKEVAQANGISKKLFAGRVIGSGWAPEKAATKAPKKGVSCTYNWTDVEMEMAKKNGLDKNYMDNVKQRIRAGWTREDAINTPILSEKDRLKRVVKGTRKYHERRKRDGLTKTV